LGVFIITISVVYKGDWTADLRSVDVRGEFLASTFYEEKYIGLLAIETSSVDEVVETIHDHQSVRSVEVVNETPSESDRTLATLLIHELRTEGPTPAQKLHDEGFLPYGSTKLRDGREIFDLLVEDHDDIENIVNMMGELGTVEVRHISRGFNRQIIPSIGEWQELLETFPPRQLEALRYAHQEGYYEIPRQVTLEEIAEELSVTKTTASHQLRRANRELAEFFIKYLTMKK
jgi:predicted DNA binding protein